MKTIITILTFFVLTLFVNAQGIEKPLKDTIDAKIAKAISQLPKNSLDTNQVKKLIVAFAVANLDSFSVKTFTTTSTTTVNADTLFIASGSYRHFQISINASGSDAGEKYGDVSVKNIGGNYTIESSQFKDSLPNVVGDAKVSIVNGLPIIRLFPSSNTKTIWTITKH